MKPNKTQNSLDSQKIAAHNIIQAGSIYCAQLRAMMAPLFCSVSVLTQLNAVKIKFKRAVEENEIHLSPEIKKKVLEIAQEIFVHDNLQLNTLK